MVMQHQFKKQIFMFISFFVGFTFSSELDDPICYELQGVYSPGMMLDSGFWELSQEVTIKAAYDNHDKIDDIDKFKEELKAEFEEKRWWFTDGGYNARYFDYKNSRRIYYEFDKKDSLRFKEINQREKKLEDICIQFISNRIKLYYCNNTKDSTVWDAKYSIHNDTLSFNCTKDLWFVKKKDMDSLVFDDLSFHNSKYYSDGTYMFKRRKCIPLGKYKSFFSKCIRFSMRLDRYDD